MLLHVSKVNPAAQPHTPRNQSHRLWWGAATVKSGLLRNFTDMYDTYETQQQNKTPSEANNNDWWRVCVVGVGVGAKPYTHEW